MAADFGHRGGKGNCLYIK